MKHQPSRDEGARREGGRIGGRAEGGSGRAECQQERGVGSNSMRDAGKALRAMERRVRLNYTPAER